MGLLTLVGCGPVAERTLIEQFFAASRLRDLTALSKVATVVFEPATDGIVTSFDIVEVAAGSSSDLKTVLISAPVRLPDGREVVKRFALTVQRGMITAISERPASPSIPRS